MSVQDEFIETSTAMRVKMVASFVTLVSVLESARRWLLPPLIEHARTLPSLRAHHTLRGTRLLQSRPGSRLRRCSGLSPCHALYARAKLLAAL